MLAAGENPNNVSLNGSDRHRDLWNKVAQETGVPIRWVKDVGEPHRIDSYETELEIAPEQRHKFGLPSNGPITMTPSLWNEVANLHQLLELKRQGALADSLSRRRDVVSYVDISHLTDGEKHLIDFVQERITPLINQLQIIQRDSRFPEWDKKIAEQTNRGDLQSYKQWERRHDDVCYPGTSDFCSVFPDFPNKRPEFDESPVWTIIPSDITEADKKAIDELWKGKTDRNPFLSPFTVVERDGKGGFKWTPMSTHSLTHVAIAELSETFGEASRIAGIAPGMAKQFAAWSKALQSKEAYPFDDAERATIWQDDGNVEVTLDVSPSYVSFGKSAIALAGGIVRPGEDQFAREHVRPILQVLENRLGTLLPGIYTPRKLRTDIPVRFIDNIFRDAATQQNLAGEYLAYAFPTGTKVSDEEGVAKRVACINHLGLKFDHIYTGLAKAALDPEQLRYVTPRAVNMFTLLHEMSHGVGPQHGTKSLSGEKVVVALGAINDRIEEAKADTGGMSAIPFLTDIIDEEFAKELYVTFTVGLIRQMRLGGRAHGGSAAMLFGGLAEAGAVTVIETTLPPAEDSKETRKEKRFHIDFAHMPAGIESLWANVSKQQMQGDKALAEAYMKESAKKIPDLMDEMTAKFVKLGLPSDLRIHYRLVDGKKN